MDADTKPPLTQKVEKKKKSKGKPPPNFEEPVAVQPPERPVPPIAESKPPATSEKGAKKKSSKSSSGKTAGSGATEAVAEPPKPKKFAVNAIEAATPVVAPENDPAVETVDDDGGYGDDDFENYSDEGFEQDDENVPNRTALVSIKRANREDANDALGSRDLSEVQQALRAENASAMERRRVQATEIVPTAEAKGGVELSKGGSAPRGAKGQAKSSKTPSSAPRPVRKYLGDLGADLGRASLRTDDPRVLRVKEIQKNVQFHQERSTIFEQPSMSKYDLYLRQLRSLNKTVSQESSQSNEDNRSVEVQTDEIEMESKGAQFQFGDDDTILVSLLTALKNGDSLADLAGVHHQDSSSSVSSQATLAHFLRHATPAVEALLMEDEAKAIEKDAVLNPLREAPRLFQDEQWTSLQHSVMGASHSILCSCQRSFVLALHASTSGVLQGKSFIVVWDLMSPTSPSHVLVSDNDVTCACFSPTSSSVVLAGSVEGGILLWNIHETPSTRATQTAADLGLKCAVHFPAFRTHLSPARTQMHTSSIVALAPNPSRASSTRNESSSQFASLDDRGVVCFWVVSESTPNASLDDNDHGSSGLLRLVCSRVVSVWGPADDPRGGSSPSSLCFDLEQMTLTSLLDSMSPGPSVQGVSFYPWDPNKCVVLGSDGRLLQRSRFGAPPSPRTFSCGTTGHATCVDSSPFLSGLFLAGYADGCIRLFNSAFETPLTTWHASRAQHSGTKARPLGEETRIIQVQWSPQRPGVFFVLDSEPCLHAFDLLQDGTVPIFSEPITKQSGEQATCSSRHSFAIGCSLSRSSFAVVASRGSSPQFITISRALTMPRPQEIDDMNSFLDDVL